MVSSFLALILVFQSTPPEWGATFRLPFIGPYCNVSIHAPRVGSDLRLFSTSQTKTCFNPRPPSGERRVKRPGGPACPAVSIHAPRVGSDFMLHVFYFVYERFNPRPPSGERLRDADLKYSKDGFQSTPPEWGATQKRENPCLG